MRYTWHGWSSSHWPWPWPLHRKSSLAGMYRFDRLDLPFHRPTDKNFSAKESRRTNKLSDLKKISPQSGAGFSDIAIYSFFPPAPTRAQIPPIRSPCPKIRARAFFLWPYQNTRKYGTSVGGGLVESATSWPYPRTKGCSCWDAWEDTKWRELLFSCRKLKVTRVRIVKKNYVSSEDYGEDIMVCLLLTIRLQKPRAVPNGWSDLHTGIMVNHGRGWPLF